MALANNDATRALKIASTKTEDLPKLEEEVEDAIDDNNGLIFKKS